MTRVLSLDVSTLQARIRAGETFSLRLFYGHTPRPGGKPSPAVFSQFFSCSFEIEGQRYRWAEQWMMAEKARLFGDAVTEARVLAATTPFEVKQLGRSVTPYDDARWSAVRYHRVVRGNLAKFGQDPALADYLLSTTPDVLVEAAANDAVWGIGLGRDDPAANDPLRWPGLNLLGFALMQVRQVLAEGAAS